MCKNHHNIIDLYQLWISRITRYINIEALVLGTFSKVQFWKDVHLQKCFNIVAKITIDLYRFPSFQKTLDHFWIYLDIGYFHLLMIVISKL
jgi:hypothetical protein